jgi:hypothetical protein
LAGHRAGQAALPLHAPSASSFPPSIHGKADHTDEDHMG